MLKKIKTSTMRTEDCLNVSSFLSQNAFSRNPNPRKTMAAMNRAIVAEVSLNINETITGIIVKIPDICITNPRLDRSARISKRVKKKVFL